MARIKSLDLDALSDLYSAATDDVAWKQFSDKLAHYLGVNTAGVWIIENGIIAEIIPSSSHAETVGPYSQYFAKLDPWSARLVQTRDVVVLTPEIFEERDLVATEFFNDFAKPFGHFRPMGVHISVEPGVSATIAIENRYTDNLFEMSDKKMLEPAVVHLRRIIQLRRLWAKQKSQTNMLRASIDALGFGMIACHSDGRVALMNSAAEELLQRLGNVRFSSVGPLSGSRNRDETRRLAQYIHDACRGGAGGVMPLVGIEGLPVVTALVSPTGHHAIGDGERYALVALQPSTGVAFLTERAIANSFGLTPAQASVAHALLNGSNVEEIVAQRGVKVSTVRSQLAAIFARTGTTNQRELVRMLSTLPAIRL